jgi:hypothetical protein
MKKLSRDEIFAQIEEERQVVLDNQVNELYQQYGLQQGPVDIWYDRELAEREIWLEQHKKVLTSQSPITAIVEPIENEESDKRKEWFGEYIKFLKSNGQNDFPKDFPNHFIDDDRKIVLPKSKRYKDLLKEYLSNYKKNISYENIKFSSYGCWVIQTSDFLGIERADLVKKIEVSEKFFEVLRGVSKTDSYYEKDTRKQIVDIIKKRNDYDIFIILKEELGMSITTQNGPSSGEALYQYHGINFKRE